MSLLALLLPLAFLAACSDDAAIPTQVVEVEVGNDGRDVIPTTPGDDSGVDGTDPSTYHRILIAATDTEKEVNRGGEVALTVILLDTNGEQVAGDRVDWEILNDDGTAELSAMRTRTDETGLARVDFLAGDELVEYTVKAYHREGRPVEFSVRVVDLPAGDITVTIDYEGPVALGDIEVYLVDDPSWCENPYYMAPPEGVVQSETLQGAEDSWAIGPLIAGTRYGVVVRARIASTGILAGGGCLDDIVVRDGENRRVNVALFLLPLDPSGSYTTINNYDFTGAIPGTLGTVIDNLVRFFGSQNQEREIASLIFDLLETLVREAIGGLGALVVDLVGDWLEDDLNDIINDYIDGDAPDWVQDFFLVGQDIVGVVSYMEVISKIRLSKARRDGTFDGSENWLGMVFYWRLPCDGDPDPECGRYEFTMNEVTAAAEGIQLVFGQFTGRVHSYNQAIFDEHTMDLQYGRLIVFVLNNIILPWIADGATSLREALLNMADCPNFADGVTGGRSHLRLGGINIVSRDSIEGWCTTIMGLAGSAGESIINNLRIDTRLTVTGRMSLVEETNDLRVDALVDGIWTGSIRTSQDQGPPFEGTFRATRDGQAPVPE